MITFMEVARFVGTGVILFAGLVAIWSIGVWFVTDATLDKFNKVTDAVDRNKWDLIYLGERIGNLEKARHVGSDAVPRTCGTNCVPANKQPAAEGSASTGETRCYR
jgi:hypothetical protein